MKTDTRSIALRLLVLDDKVSAALGSLDRGLAAYAEPTKLTPKKIENGLLYELPPVAGTIPAVRLEVITNNRDCLTSESVIRALANNGFHGHFDGVLLDDNWGGNKFQGHQDILPALIRCPQLDPKQCLQIAIYSMHFVGTLAKDSRDAKVLGAFEQSLPHHWKGRVTKLEKSDFQGFVDWFAMVVRNRPPETISIVIDTSRGCAIRIGKKTLHSMFKRYCVLGYLKLAAEKRAEGQPQDLAAMIQAGATAKSDIVWQTVADLAAPERQKPGVTATFTGNDVSKVIDFLKKSFLDETILPELDTATKEELSLPANTKGEKTRNAPEFAGFFDVVIVP